MLAAAPLVEEHSKDPDGPVLLLPTDAWRSFVAATVAGEFDDV
ncbi:DUF397 domain-containing protein [Kitasatospora sp. NPDC094011]